MSRTFAIGDIHGHATLLQDLLALIRPHAASGDTLVFVGDYIDRGNDSAEVVDMVLALQAGGWDGPVITLRGNHEDWLLDQTREKPLYGDLQDWLDCGGQRTLESYWERKETAPKRVNAVNHVVPVDHLRFFNSLLYRYEDEHAHYVHAGFEPGFPIDQQAHYTMLWIRDVFLRRVYDWGKPVVFGHTPMFNGMFKDAQSTDWQPLNQPEKIGIDTGAGFGGPLTAVLLPERQFFSVRR